MTPERKPTNSELRRSVRALEKRFARAGKTVVVVELPELIRFMKDHNIALATLADQSGNGFDMWPMPHKGLVLK